MIARLLVLLLLLSSQPSFGAKYVFDYTPGCHGAYQRYMALDLKGGTGAIRQEMMANPYNLMTTYLADYEDCLLLLMNGDKTDYEQREGHLEERLKLIAQGDNNNPWYRLCKGGLYFHWALVYLRFGEQLKAATTFRKSFMQLKENNRLFPEFPQNKIFMGVEEAVVGTIPEEYQWLASIFGMKGSVKKGVAQLTSFINSSGATTPLRQEAVIYNCYIRFYLMSQQEEVWNFVNSSAFPVHNNLFHAFIRANLALNYRKAEAAIRVLNAARTLEQYQLYPIMDYEMGSALLHQLDPDAVTHFHRFLSRYNGRFFIKDTYQKLAYAFYLQRDMAKAQHYRGQILKKGSKTADADKQAQRFAAETSWPALPILQGRLLADGGYYQQALQKLQSCDVKTLGIADKLECYFRLARVYDELDNDGKAIQYYQTTINLGRARPEHFAARSSLQMGLLHERAGRTEEAIRSYNECLSMKQHDFQANIDQQAKAGINRLTQR